jgi:hypothetical protein
MEDFNFSDIALDDATLARVDHAEFLNTIKNWGTKMGTVLQPFIGVANILCEDEVSKEDLGKISIMFPLGLRLALNQINTLYDIIQKEAIKVLGAPFAVHDEHHPDCDGNKDNCGHQDHWLNKEEE